MSVARLGLIPCIMFVKGCGTMVPSMNLLGEDQQRLEEVELIQLIKCELHFGAQEVRSTFGDLKDPIYNVGWLNNWEAKVTLKISVDEKSTLSPGATYKDPLKSEITQFSGIIPQNFSASFGLQASSQATRTETIAFSYKFKALLEEKDVSRKDCQEQAEGKIVISDLKIPDFMLNKAYVSVHPDTVPSKAGRSPYSVFGYDVTFIVTYGGNATPTWNLVHITANANSPLYNAVRSKTHSLILTLGEVGSSQVAAEENARLIGDAVARALSNEQ